MDHVKELVRFHVINVVVEAVSVAMVVTGSIMEIVKQIFPVIH